LYGNNIERVYEDGELTSKETPYQEKQSYGYMAYDENGKLKR
jgi:hypothetical protein